MSAPSPASLALELSSTLHALTFLSALRSSTDVRDIRAVRAIAARSDLAVADLEAEVFRLAGLGLSDFESLLIRHRWWLVDDLDVGALLVLYSGRLVEYPVDLNDAHLVERLVDASIDIQAVALLDALVRGMRTRGETTEEAPRSAWALMTRLGVLLGRVDLASTTYRSWRATMLRIALQGRVLDEDSKAALRALAFRLEKCESWGPPT